MPMLASDYSKLPDFSHPQRERLDVLAEYDGDPTNNLTPTHIGQFCLDTANAAIYMATSTAAAGWKKITP